MWNIPLGMKAFFTYRWEFGRQECLKDSFRLTCLGGLWVAKWLAMLIVQFVYVGDKIILFIFILMHHWEAKQLCVFQLPKKAVETQATKLQWKFIACRDGPVLHVSTLTEQGWKHKKTNLLWKHGGKERPEDYSTSVRYTMCHAADIEQCSCLPFLLCFIVG